MRRRTFLGALGGMAAWPIAALAQQPERMRRIGVLMRVSEDDSEGRIWLAAFVQSLVQSGWRPERNISIQTHWAGSNINSVKEHVAALVSQKPDAILVSSTLGVFTLQQQTNSIPIVFVELLDPVANGLVDSLNRPGGHITGFTNFEYAIIGKWLELLKEMAPRLTRVVSVFDARNRASDRFIPPLEAAARGFGIKASVASVNNASQIEDAFRAISAEPDGGAIVPPGPVLVFERNRIIELAQRHKVPTIFGARTFAENGGLMSYGIDIADSYRKAATYIDKILKGAKPGELPVEQPNKFQLVINRKSAAAIGMSISSTLLARADEVIE